MDGRDLFWGAVCVGGLLFAAWLWWVIAFA
jgi:hypothetical protein